MSMFTAFNISASGMTAQQLRTDVISQNIANVNTEKTLTASTAVTGSSSNGSSFASVLKQAHNGLLGDGVKVTSVYEDNSTDMNMVYDPSHPDADENGYVTYPNVNVVQEMTDLIDASRSYEANISAFNASKTMANKGLTIGEQ